jgi:hypothetical protein
MTDDHDRLNRYLDALVTGKETSSIPLDPELVAVIGDLKNLDSVPAPDLTFINDLEERLMSLHAQAGEASAQSWLRNVFFNHLTPVGTRSGNGAATHRRWTWSEALAGVVMLALVLGLVLDAYGRTWFTDNGTSGPGGTAILAPDTPEAADPTDQVLVEALLTADFFANSQPDGDALSFWLAKSVVPANTTDPWEATLREGYPGLELQFVLDGSISVTAADPVKVIRSGSDGTAEEIEAGTAITLDMGDALIHRTDQSSVWTTGDAPATLLSATVVANDFLTAYSAKSWQNLALAYIDDAGPLPTGLTRIQLRSVVLEPESSISFGDEVRKLFFMEPGKSGFLGESSDGSLSLRGVNEPRTVYLLTIEPATTEGTPTL